MIISHSNNCKQVIIDKFINNTSNKHILSFKEVPFLFFDADNCTTKRTNINPIEPLWNTELQFQSDSIPFKEIQSIYIPPHATIEFHSKHKHISKIKGPALIPKLSSYLQTWDNGNKIEYNNTQINHIIVYRHKKWTDYLTNFKHHEQNSIPLTNDHTLQMPINFDNYFQNFCNNNLKSPCLCINAFEDMKHSYPAIYKQLWVEHLYPSCNIKTQYVPSYFKPSNNNKVDEECKEMIHLMLKSNNFPIRDIDNNKSIFKCGGEIYKNAFSSGETDELKVFDDTYDDMLEKKEMVNNNNNNNNNNIITDLEKNDMKKELQNFLNDLGNSKNNITSIENNLETANLIPSVLNNSNPYSSY
jgi:hypothetical protein